MMFTAKDVKELRERTGCGMMDCKKALTESNGDMEKAIEFLREKGLAAATKKAGRIAAEGIVTTYVNDAATVGSIIEVNSETDFVAKNADFQSFVAQLAKIVADENPADLDTFMTMKYDDAMTVEAALQDKILTIGENMKIRRFARYEGKVASYVHGGGKIGVLTLIEGDDTNAAKEVAMHIAAINPLYMSKDIVPEADVEKEKNIIIAQIKEDPKNASKPDAIIEKMVGGKIGKFFEQNCLLEQEFCVNPDFKVAKYLESKGVKLVDYVRFEKGEGLEKREDNFADEVASMIK
ncbi:MAG: elongation factor Ts [Clostridia bacterium]|nr:elongation factor Ts [Clostridia bacterium]